MNGEGQRPPGTDPQPAHDAPEPGNARYPQNTPNGQQQQSAEGGGRRRFRRQRRGGRGRGRNRGQHQQNVQAPLDAQGRILDVENDMLPDDGGPDAVPQPGDPQAVAAQGDPQGSQSGADITRSWASRWIWCRSASRRLGSSSRACCTNRSSMSG